MKKWLCLIPLVLLTSCVSNRVEIAEELMGLETEVLLLRDDYYASAMHGMTERYPNPNSDDFTVGELRVLNDELDDIDADAEIYLLMLERIEALREFTGIRNQGKTIDALNTAFDIFEEMAADDEK